MKLRVKYIQTWIDAKTGKAYAYFRRPGFPRIRLPGTVYSPEFWAGYKAALAGEQPAAAVEAAQKVASLIEAAITRYIAEALPVRVNSASTRARQSSTLRTFARLYGTSSVTAINADFVKKQVREAPTVGVGRTWLITVREFCKWAVEEKLLDADPTAGIVIKLPKSDGHYCWEEEDIAKFEARWPIGTRERLLFSLLIYTGQRCSDVLKLGRHSIKDNTFPIKQQKTGVDVFVPVHSELAKAIAAWNVVGIHSDTFLTTKTGKPLNQRNLNELFRDACTAAGLPDKFVPHGLRKAFCRRLADLGVPPHQIAALSGHLTLKEVMRYTAAYDRRQAAKVAMAKLEAAA